MPSYAFLPYEALPEQHQLPDPFVTPDGGRVTSPEQWPAQRDYLKAMLAHYLYGQMPPAPGNVRGTVTDSAPALDGLARCDTVRLTFGPADSLSMTLQCYRPNRPGRCPVLLWITFGPREQCPVLEELLRRGIAVVAYDKEQLGVDSHAFVAQSPCLQAYPDYTWRAIAVWAWGVSRAIDYLANTDYVNPDQIAVTGYSRNGKIALCAAIYDERIALCAPGGSGCGGSGCFRFVGDRFGEGGGLQETIGSMSLTLSYWWADELRQFGAARTLPVPDLSQVTDPRELGRYVDTSVFGKVGPEFRLPFDMHTARALVAPRYLLATDSLDDSWANPYGILVTWRAAGEVYRFLGAEDHHAMLFREGPHAFSYTDWIAISDFLMAKFCGEDPKRSLFTTLQVPRSPEALQNPMFSQNYSHTPHFDWRAPEPSALVSNNT